MQPHDHDPESLSRWLDDLRQHLTDARDAWERETAQAQPGTRTSLAGQQPVRLTVLDGLADLGYPTSSRTLGAFLAARFGREIPATQFGTIAAQERAAFVRNGISARLVWLCSGLTADGYRPIKQIWSRSDWPLSWRIVAATSSRVQHLHTTEAMCRLAARAEEEAQDPAALRALALAHAADLPGINVNRTHPEFGRYAAVAGELLQKYEPEDRRHREAAATALTKLPVQIQLFGIQQGEPSQPGQMSERG
jgi:hypothetical protein